MKSRSTKDRPTNNPSGGWVFLLKSGVNYYVAGRYALFARLTPTAGNLLHHAIEMFLKGALGKTGKSLEELEELRYKLPKIWNEFKTNFPEHSLDAFDPLICELHKFEEIRYPDVLAAF